jgi:hypothetical protein
MPLKKAKHANPLGDESTFTDSSCYPNCHMNWDQLGFYSLCYSIAFNNDKLLTYSGRSIAALTGALPGTKRSTHKKAASLVTELVDGGWFELLNESKYLGSAKRSARKFRVLSHDEWASKHPNCCPTVKRLGESFGHAGLAEPTGIGLGGSDGPVGGSSGPIDGLCGVQVVNTELILNKEAAAIDVPSGVYPATATPVTPQEEETQDSGGGSDRPTKSPLSAMSSTANPALSMSRELIALFESRMLIKQQTDGITSAAWDVVAKHPVEAVKKLLDWIAQDKFWSTRVYGKGALRSFIRNFGTISKQYETAANKAIKGSRLKSANVAPPAEGFKYQGEIV